MTIEQITDHAERAKARLPHFVRDSANLKALLDIAAEGTQALETTLHDLLTKRAIKKAEDAQLDGIGGILGLPREVGQTDSPYRSALQAQAAKLMLSGEPEAVIVAYKTMWAANKVYLAEFPPAKVELTATLEIDEQEADTDAQIKAAMGLVCAGGIGKFFQTVEEPAFFFGDAADADPVDGNLPTSDAGLGGLAEFMLGDSTDPNGDNEASPNGLGSVVLNGSWSQVGTDLNISGASYAAVAALNITDVAYLDNGNNELRTYRFDGTSWALVGNGLSFSGTISTALAALNSTDVAYYDEGNEEISAYGFDGAVWTQLTGSLSISGVSGVALAALNDTDVAFIDNSNQSLRLYRYSGTSWLLKASSDITDASGSALAALNETDVAFVDAYNAELRTYRFGGAGWTQVGNSLSVTGIGSPALAALNDTDVALIDDSLNVLKLYRFDGTDWAQVGSSLAVSNGYPNLAALNGSDVAFIDVENDDLRVYRSDVESADLYTQEDGNGGNLARVI